MERNPIEGYEGLIWQIARTLYRPTHLYSADDLYQVGCMCVIKIDRSFDDSKAKRSTFYTICVRREIIRYINKFRNDHLVRQVKRAAHDHSSLWEFFPENMSELEGDVVEMLIDGYIKPQIMKKHKLTALAYKKILIKLGKHVNG